MNNSPQRQGEKNLPYRYFSNSILLLFLLLFLVTSCHRQLDKLEPKISYAVQDRYLQQLPAPFATLSTEERETDWGREYLIGIAFAHKLDLYQAITAFKRAEILAPKDLEERRLELDYEILLCYYLGQKYNEAINLFENSRLRLVNTSFPATHDLLTIMYDCYQKTDEPEKAQGIFQVLHELYPDTADKLTISTAMMQASLPTLEKIPSLQSFVTEYRNEKKSVPGAQALNAVLPGAGYLYLGQKQLAITAFLLNGLFIAAAYHFFDHGDIAAGIIVTSFETGWYFGGIYGAGQEAKLYNERLYESKATPLMNQERLFPVLMLTYGF